MTNICFFIIIINLYIILLEDIIKIRYAKIYSHLLLASQWQHRKWYIKAEFKPLYKCLEYNYVSVTFTFQEKTIIETKDMCISATGYDCKFL